MHLHNGICEWLLLTVQLMVDRPEEASIEVREADGRVIFQIHVHPSDIGKVIGRQARAARSIRILARTMATKFRIPPFAVEIPDHRSLGERPTLLIRGFEGSIVVRIRSV